ncbi:RPOLA_N domain-containing protein [Trichonephila clavata]|nr:RPOLA_N domain-containing protein [Trichonephila clavata]GFR29518.1 RPOLA_N domain-containing protein [Trichonephila clavata]
MIHLLKAWRNKHTFSNTCSTCCRKLDFGSFNFKTCCNQFYYLKTRSNHPVESIAVETRRYTFALPHLLKHTSSDQEFVVFNDPLYWQVSTTLIYEKVMKFVMGHPMTRRTQDVQPPEKSHFFYKQLQEAPLNHGSMVRRSCGKTTLMRQYVFGKRCILSMRGTISADSSLEPNELRVSTKLTHLVGQHVLVNRMPSLQPENVLDLKVVGTWQADCFGLPLEVLESLHADFDGDEINVWIFENMQSRAECMFLLNSRFQMGSKITGLKLSPCQDMLVVFYLMYDRINFLPYKDPHKDLKKTFRTLYDLYGSEKTYQWFNEMRLYYLDVLQNQIVFATTLEEILNLVERAKKSFSKFQKKIPEGCLTTQVLSKAKGSFYHLYQMVGSIGYQHYNINIKNSFWDGLNPCEAVAHATTSFDALLQSGKIWEPGYGYSKSVYNLQGLYVDYRGRLMDGKRMIEKDVLNTMDCTDLLSDGAFLELIRTKLKCRKRKYSNIN